MERQKAEPISPVEQMKGSNTTPQLIVPDHDDDSASQCTDDVLETQLSPKTPRRTQLLARGLSLQMPVKNDNPQPLVATSNHTTLQSSPQLEPNVAYGSTATSLPRHSRGLDFSRASTNLHHSTLAESSPDSSPVITTNRNINFSSRKGSVNSILLDSPNLGPSSSWPMFLNAEKSLLSTSIGSNAHLGSPMGSSDSDEDNTMDGNDQTLSAPNINRLTDVNTANHQQTLLQPLSSPGLHGWPSNFSPATASLLRDFRQVRFRQSRSRKSSIGSVGHGGNPSPRTCSPPAFRSYDAAIDRMFPYQRDGQAGVKEQDVGGDEARCEASNTYSVVRRAVTRRGNLLPKTKVFARVRAALAEESMPVDTDVRKEAETIRQVWERDPSSSQTQKGNNVSSSEPDIDQMIDEMAEESSITQSSEVLFNTNMDKGLNACFSTHAAQHANTAFWNGIDRPLRTPPPPNFARTASVATDVTMDSPIVEISSTDNSGIDRIGRTSTVTPILPTLVKTIGKRTRDDDLDQYSLKRRAVSPSLSVSNSPVVRPSPKRRDSDRDRETWGDPPRTMREGSIGASASAEWAQTQAQNQPQTLRCCRSNSNGSAGSSISGPSVPANGNAFSLSTPRRVGLQSMTDTNDGLMKMSID